MADGVRARARANSLRQGIEDVQENAQTDFVATATTGLVPNAGQKRSISSPIVYSESRGLFKDIYSMRWMRVPESSFKMLALPILLYFNWNFFTSNIPNPFEPLIFISHKVPGSPSDAPLYAKGYKDLAFISYYIIVWSFIRQLITLKVIPPMARVLGIGRSKYDRFSEQGYALLYWSAFGAWGVYIMARLPTWWYRTEYFWLGYPAWQMHPQLKLYYLLQAAYWLQQLILLALRMEKPRKDFTVLVLHHIVTLWLIGWSYLINLTLIGNAVFVSMDIPDAVFALSKLLNYISMGYATFAKKIEFWSLVSFAIFVPTWTYFRHWLNLVIMWSVWFEYDLVPTFARQWNPPQGTWMPPWMMYQVFIPIALLQCIQLFWYYLIWRILIRTLMGSDLNDERSDDEDEGEDDKAE